MARLTELWSGLSPVARRGIVAGGVGASAVALVAAVALSGGSEEPEAAPKPTTTTSTTTTTAVVTTTTEPQTGPIAPLTGLRVEDGFLLLRPALAVKVDNLDAPSETAVPQSGLPRADVVFEEVVEGNITRLVAVFHSQQPGRVGPVRSARTTDVELLPQLVEPLLAWSGGNEGVTGAVRSSPWIIDAGWDQAPGSYARDSSRRAPHNLYAQGDELWQLAPEGTPTPRALFRYRTSGQEMPSTAQPSQGVDISWGSGGAVAPVSWRWDGDLRLYVRTQRGKLHKDEDGTVLTARNVVVMATEYGQSAADSRSPEAKTVGSGELFVFTNGRVIHGRWDRPDITRPAALTDDEGNTILLSPGQTWVELPRPGSTSAITG